MRKLAIVIGLLLVAGSARGAGVANKIYQKPLLPNPTPEARFYIYDPVTDSDRNITWGLLSGFFAPVAPPWESITGKPAEYPPAAHTQAISTITGLQSALDQKASTLTLATVATSGQYSDLSGLPALFSGNYADLIGTPVLFSGVYADLTGKPALFSGAYADLTGKPAIPATTTDVPEGSRLYFTTARAAAAAPVQSVAGKTGAVSLIPTDVGLVETCTGRVSWDGIDGPPNVLTIGTVTAGSYGTPAAATITGTSPSQVLNLTLPMGAPGPANSLGIGTVSTGSYGTPAAANITGTAPTQTLNLTLPMGAAGPASTLTIGTVTTGAPGSAAAATITGTAPNYTLNLTIPEGDPGTASISRDQMTTELANASNVVVVLQPATNSATAGGLVINDYFGTAAVLLRNGSIEVRDTTSGVAIAKIDRATGSIASYDTSGNVVAKMTRDSFYTLKADGSAGLTWSRTELALVIQ